MTQAQLKMDRHRASQALALALLFFSGLAGAACQLIFVRMLVLLLGSTATCLASVLVALLGGLAAGFLISEWFAAHAKRPALSLAVLQAMMGLWALLTPFSIRAAAAVVSHTGNFAHMNLPSFDLVSPLVTCMILLPPAMATGACLPVLSRLVRRSSGGTASNIGFLYALLMLGGSAGLFLSGCFLLPARGAQVTLLLGAGLHILLCLLSVFLSRIPGEVSMQAPARENSQQEKTGAHLPPMSLLMLPLSGAITMLYAPGFLRALMLALGSGTDTLCLLLSIFLLGIGGGSLISSMWADRLKEPDAWFAGLELMACLWAVVAVNLFNFVPYGNLAISTFCQGNSLSALLLRALLSSVVLLPPCLCLGATFPLALKSGAGTLETLPASAGRSSSSTVIGSLCALNFLGALGGALLSSLVLLQGLGAEKSLIAGAAASLSLGALLFSCGASISLPLKALCAVVSVPAVVVLLSQPARFDLLAIMSGQSGSGDSHSADNTPLPPFALWQKELHQARHLIFFADGVCSSKAVIGLPGSNNHLLVSDGLKEASTRDLSSQVALFSFPLAFRRHIQEIVAIGWGAGAFSDNAAMFGQSSFTCLEIEPLSFDAARAFRNVDCSRAVDCRLPVEVSDGRRYLLSCHKLLDLIVCNSGNPQKGIACNSYTSEFFSACRQSLKSDGVLSLKLPYAEMSSGSLLRVLSALASVFPYCLPLQSTASDIVVLASDKPLLVDYQSLRPLFVKSSSNRLAIQLTHSGIIDAEDFLCRILAEPESFSKFALAHSPNTDDCNCLEYDLTKARTSSDLHRGNKNLFDESSGKPWQAVNWGSLDQQSQAAAMAAVAARAVAEGAPQRGFIWAQRSCALRRSATALATAGVAALDLGDKIKGLTFLHEALALSPGDVVTLETRGIFYLNSLNLEAARQDFASVLALKKDDPFACYCMAQTYMTQARQMLPGADVLALVCSDDVPQPKEALKYLRVLLSEKAFLGSHPEALLLAAVASFQTDDLVQAEKLSRSYLSLEPFSPFGWRTLGATLDASGRSCEAAVCWDRSMQLAVPLSNDLVARAAQALSGKRAAEAVLYLSRSLTLLPGNPEARSLLESLSAIDPRAKRVLELTSRLPSR